MSMYFKTLDAEEKASRIISRKMFPKAFRLLFNCENYTNYSDGNKTDIGKKKNDLQFAQQAN